MSVASWVLEEDSGHAASLTGLLRNVRGNYRLAKKTGNREHDARDPHDQASNQRKLAQEKKHATRPCVGCLSTNAKAQGGTSVLSQLFLVVVASGVVAP
jgi:hypothetical protein